MSKRRRLLTSGIIILLVASAFMAYGTMMIDDDTDDIRVACIGDSITKGSSYPNKLQEMLGENYSVRNFGVDGSTITRNALLPYMHQDEFIEALEFEPQVVVIMLGTNDANPEKNYNGINTFEEDYTELVKSFQALDGDQQIFLVKSPPILAVNSPYNNSYLVKTVFPHIDKLVEDLNLTSIDMYSSMGENTEYFFDGVHPNDDGANVIALTIYDALT